MLFPQFHTCKNIFGVLIYLNASLFISENELRFNTEVPTDLNCSSLIRSCDKIRSCRLERQRFSMYLYYFSCFPSSCMENAKKRMYAYQIPSMRSSSIRWLCSPGTRIWIPNITLYIATTASNIHNLDFYTTIARVTHYFLWYEIKCKNDLLRKS